MHITSQTTRILRLLKLKGAVSNRELNRVGYRYGARIYELRQEGHRIVTNRVKDGLFEFVYKGHPDDDLPDNWDQIRSSASEGDDSQIAAVE